MRPGRSWSCEAGGAVSCPYNQHRSLDLHPPIAAARHSTITPSRTLLTIPRRDLLGGCFGNWSSGSQIMEQRAYTYAALVEDRERIVDEARGAKGTLAGLTAR